MDAKGRNNNRNDDCSSRSSGGISFECHDMLFSEELLSTLLHQEDEGQVKAANDSVDDIINKEIATSKTYHSNTSLLSIAENKSDEESSMNHQFESETIMRKFEKRVIEKHTKTGRLRRVVSSADALNRRKGQEQGSTHPGARRIRTIASFNNVPSPPAALNNRDTPGSNAVFENRNDRPPMGHNKAAVSAGRALLGAPSVRSNKPSVSAGRALLGAPSVRSPSSRQGNNATRTRSNVFGKVNVEDFAALVGHPGFALAGNKSTSKSTDSLETNTTAKESFSSLLSL